MVDKLSIKDPSANISDSAPKSTPLDATHTALKMAISSVPILGSPALELFNSIVVPPRNKRMDEWIESIVAGLKVLQEHVEGFSIENLKDDESFITTVSHASQIAIRNHQTEKLKALKNAVLNSALRRMPDDDLQQIFLNIVDSSTEWHLLILGFLDDPSGWFKSEQRQPPNLYMGSTATVMESAFEELRGRRNFYDFIVEDLNTKGLIGTNSLHTTMTGDGTLQSKTTELGRQFLMFISETE